MNIQSKNQYYSNQIMKLLSMIEDITQVMAHEDPNIDNDLRSYQDDKLKPVVFYIRLQRYYDKLSGITI